MQRLQISVTQIKKSMFNGSQKQRLMKQKTKGWKQQLSGWPRVNRETGNT